MSCPCRFRASRGLWWSFCGAIARLQRRAGYATCLQPAEARAGPACRGKPQSPRCRSRECVILALLFGDRTSLLPKLVACILAMHAVSFNRHPPQYPPQRSRSEPIPCHVTGPTKRLRSQNLLSICCREPPASVSTPSFFPATPPKRDLRNLLTNWKHGHARSSGLARNNSRWRGSSI